MALLTPPPRPPRVALDENDGLRRMHLRQWQIKVSAITVFLTAWCCTLGAIPAIVALVVAKDVLVAILLFGVGVAAQVNAGQRPENRPSPKLDWRLP